MIHGGKTSDKFLPPRPQYTFQCSTLGTPAHTFIQHLQYITRRAYTRWSIQVRAVCPGWERPIYISMAPRAPSIIHWRAGAIFGHKYWYLETRSNAWPWYKYRGSTAPLGHRLMSLHSPAVSRHKFSEKYKKTTTDIHRKLAYLAWTSGKWNILMKIGGDGGDDGDGDGDGDGGQVYPCNACCVYPGIWRKWLNFWSCCKGRRVSSSLSAKTRSSSPPRIILASLKTPRQKRSNNNFKLEFNFFS